MTQWGLRVFLLATTCAVGCGDGGGDPDGGADGGLGCRTHAGASFELGTGAEVYEGLTDGQDLEMSPGLQGGCHFWLAAQTDGFAERRLNVRYEVLFADTGTTTGSKSSNRLRLDPIEGSDGLCQFAGFTAFLIEPWNFRDRSVRIEVTLEDDEGRTATESKTVTARWPSSHYNPDLAEADWCGYRGD